jgi:PAS domain S-box-containing protein
MAKSRLTKILDSFPDMFFIMDWNGTLLDFKPSKTSKHLMPPEKYLGKSIEEVLPAEVTDTVMVNLPEVLKSGTERMFEYPQMVGDEQRYFEVRLILLDDNEVLAAVRDVTEKVVEEEDLVESESHHHRLFEENPVPMYIYDMDSLMILDVNKAMVNSYGYTRNEFVSMTIRDIRTEDNVDDLREHIASLHGEQVYLGPARHRKKDGSIIDVEVTSNHFPGRNKRARLVLCSDVTERNRVRNALEEREKQYRHLFEHNPVPMMVLDTDTLEFIDVNEAAIRHYGYTRKEFLGMTAKDIRPPEDVNRAVKRIKTLQPGTDEVGIWRHRKKDGTIIHVDILSHEISYNGRSARLALCNDVTEQIAAREALLESEEKFRSIVESSPMGIHMYRLDEEDRLVFIGANPAADKILQVDNSQFIGLTVEEAFPSSIDTEIPKKYREAASGGDPWYTEQIDYEDEKVKGAFQVFAFGTGYGTMAAMFQEITERKRAEKALIDREEKFRTSFITNPDPVTISRMEDGVLLEANEGFFNLTGYTKEEIIGQSTLDLGLWEEPDQRKELIERIRTDGQVENFEINMKMKDDSTKTALLSARTIHLEGIPCLLSVSRDITEIKRARQALIGSEEKFRAAFESSPDSILIVDQEQRIIKDVNQGFVTTTGYTREEVLGFSSDDFGIWEDSSDRDRFYEAVGKEGATDGFEANFRLKDGTISRGLLSARTVMLSGKPHLLVTVRDITSLMEAHLKLRASLDEKNVLLREIHHRVKNNLQVVSGLLNLQSHHIDDPAYKVIYRESQSRIVAMALIHEELYQSADLARVHFAHYIRSLCENLMTSYGAKKRGIKLEIDTQEAEVAMDTAIPCGLIINELVTNALKHAFPEERGGTIHLCFRQILQEQNQEESYELIVKDDGTGMAYSPDINERTTLGLQLVVHLVEQLGGTLEIEREKGTLFRITFDEYHEAGTTLY